MSKIVLYILLLMVLIFPTGCQTLNGMGQDAQNLTNPDMNGWHSIQKIDDWIKQNMW